MQSKTETPSKWGDPRANQVWVEGGYSKKTSKVIPESTGPFGLWTNNERTETRSDYVWVKGPPPDDFPDDAYDRRRFIHTCGIIKVVQIISSQSIRWSLWLDGYQSLVLNSVTIMYCDEMPSDSNAIAMITIEGLGERYGTLSNVDHHARLIFRNEDVMKAHCQAVLIQAPPNQPPRQQSRIVVTEEGNGIWPFIGGAVIGALLGDAYSQD